jgi:ABC-2 type transport system ATP-binding protein
MLQCNGLTKIYQGRRAVDNITFEMRSGRVLGLVGPNGAGKSTLLKMVTGLIWPSAGNVTIDGHDVHQNQRQALANVGAIIEWPAFYPDLSARRNLQILSGGHGPDYEKRLAEIIRMVNLEGRLKDKVGRYSTGMKQRLGIALALLPDSRFIILDEPTNGLDPLGLLEIRRIIREYNRLFGTTILVTTHLLSEIEQVADDIAVINHGRLIAFGDIDELLAGDNLLKIVVSDSAAAIRLLENAGLPIEKIHDTGDEGLHIKITDCDCIGDINERLVRNGIRVSCLNPVRKTLESFFLENTEENEHAS